MKIGPSNQESKRSPNQVNRINIIDLKVWKIQYLFQFPWLKPKNNVINRKFNVYRIYFFCEIRFFPLYFCFASHYNILHIKYHIPYITHELNSICKTFNIHYICCVGQCANDLKRVIYSFIKYVVNWMLSIRSHLNFFLLKWKFKHCMWRLQKWGFVGFKRWLPSCCDKTNEFWRSHLICLFVCLFVCFGSIVQIENFSLIWRRHY